MEEQQYAASEMSDADRYDAAQMNYLEQEIYDRVVQTIKRVLQKPQNRILDVCCGTGTIAERLRHTSGLEFTGVDINVSFLDSAREKVRFDKRFHFIHQDIFEFQSETAFDLAIITSAYHHIVDEKKAAFMRKVFEQLSADGSVVFYDKALPTYRSIDERRDANQLFYAKRLAFLQQHGLDYRDLEALLEESQRSVALDDEYKVDYERMRVDFEDSGFCIKAEQRVWPDENIFSGEQVGDFIFVLKKREPRP